jgi:hypothetical protein
MRSSLFTDFTSSWDPLWSLTDLYNMPTFHLSLPDTRACWNFRLRSDLLIANNAFES